MLSKCHSVLVNLTLSLYEQYMLLLLYTNDVKFVFSDQMSASQILTDLDILPFNKDDKVVPQISSMTENIYYGMYIHIENNRLMP